MTGALPVPDPAAGWPHGRRFTSVFRARAGDARDALRSVKRALRRAGIDPVRAGEVEIALTEAVNNVVEHSYGDPDAGFVRMNLTLRGGVLKVRLSDTGRPMPGECLPAGHPANLAVPPGMLPEGGFGWFLIRTLADDVRHERHNGTNTLSLQFRL